MRFNASPEERRRRLSQLPFEHAGERAGAVVTHRQRHIDDLVADRQPLQGGQKPRLLPPLSEGHAQFAGEMALDGFHVHLQRLRPVLQRGVVAGVLLEVVADPLQARVGGSGQVQRQHVHAVQLVQQQAHHAAIAAVIDMRGLDQAGGQQQLAQQRARGGLAGTSSEAVQSSVIGRLREQEATLIQREADLQSQFGPRHPAIGAVQNQLAHLRRMIAVEIERVAQSVRTDYERALGNEKLLSDKLEALTRQTQGADKASVRLRELQRDLDAVKAVYANFLLRAQETREQASLDTTNARIISLAQPPLQPSWPPTGLLAAAAAALGLGLGMGLALLREYAVPRLLSPAQAEAMIGAPVIAVLPSGKPAPARRRWNLGGSGASAGNAEADAGLALLRLFNSGPASATAARSLLVTSASSGDSERERVTDLLAAAAIRQGERVLLIDANVERGRQDAGRGLMDILRGESSLDEAIQFEGGKDVALMSGGRRKAPPQKALGRSFAMRMLADASRHFDVVIADAGALTTNVTIAPLVGMAEEIVLVAQLHETRLADVAKAVEAARIMGRAVTATILVEPGGRG